MIAALQQMAAHISAAEPREFLQAVAARLKYLEKLKDQFVNEAELIKNDPACESEIDI